MCGKLTDSGEHERKPWYTDPLLAILNLGIPDSYPSYPVVVFFSFFLGKDSL